MDLFGPTKTISLGGNRYVFVIVDDHPRFWVLLFSSKNEAIAQFTKLCKKIHNEKGVTISKSGSDHGGEFENYEFENFCTQNGIEHELLAARTPQQNGIVEKKEKISSRNGKNHV